MGQELSEYDGTEECENRIEDDEIARVGDHVSALRRTNVEEREREYREDKCRNVSV